MKYLNDSVLILKFMETKEKNFEADIESYLINEGGFVKGNQGTYDKKRAIDMPTMLRFVETTQPKIWQRYQNIYGENSEKQLYKVFQDNVSQLGIIHVLRNGVKDRGLNIKFCYFAPASNINEELVAKYNANILTCTRQFAYSTENNNTIDMVLSLNGIPLVALELKNQITGQSIENARLQYIHDRDPKEFIFHFDNRIVAYFCVDLTNVLMATCLLGDKTKFLPFNQGSNGAGNVGDGGNPQNPDGYMTSYLWERVLTREMFLSLFQRYISRIKEEKISLVDGKTVKKKVEYIIFPRYHQLDVVEKLVAHTRNLKDGKNFLLQHSAGSGKSNSIAWLTYRLASLHNDLDQEVFQSVFVITDRRVLNQQLQNTILGFEHLEGQIATITDKDNSSVLKDAINDGKRIIITTLHRFPIIYKELDNHSGKRFAIIVDEAHSSQGGKAAEKLKAALADTDDALREMAEQEEKTEEELKDEMDLMNETLLTQGQHKNLFFYAFTATPKPKTLQTFGELLPDGSYTAYHHYSMRQAIDEGFIKDVLMYYTTLETNYEIAKAIPDNPEYEEPPATRAVKQFHDNHQVVIDQKIAVIVEKFREVTLTKIGGKAKAMVVCPSRAHAVRYYFAMKKYCKEKGYTDVKPLVAYSGKISYQGTEYVESQLNSMDGMKISEEKLPLYFGSDMYNVLIVADKYQTGFDEPLLHSMFVDKKLKGVKAVQTLSRLNRSKEGKVDTFVMDFVNDADSIVDSFKPFYEDTLLSEGVDANKVYEYLNKLKAFYLWSTTDEDNIYKLISAKKQGKTDLGKIASALKPVLDAYNNLTEENKFQFRFDLRAFIRFYSYMANIVRTYDKELFKTYVFCDFLFKFIPKTPHEKVDLSGKLALINNKLTETFSGGLSLNPTEKEKTLKPETGGQGKPKDDQRELLSNIIDKINILYAGQFTEADKVIVETIYDKLTKDCKTLKKQAKNTDANMFANAIFPKEFEKIAQKCYMEQMDAFSKLFEDSTFYKRVMEEIGRAMYLKFKNEAEDKVKSKVNEYEIDEPSLSIAAEEPPTVWNK